MQSSTLPLAVALLALALSSAPLHAAPPPIWDDKPAEPAALEKTWRELPPPVRPAADMQSLLNRIRSGAPAAEWRTEMAKFADATGNDPVTTALRELARCWEARARMQEIDRTLRNYYRKAVRFPDKLEEVQGSLPADAKQDPWGEPWAYKPTAPQGFAKLAKQRYQIGPARYPQLSDLEQALKSPASARNWKATARQAGGAKALEVRTPDGKAAVVQPGARVVEATLAFISDGWALLADTERLFTVTF